MKRFFVSIMTIIFLSMLYLPIAFAVPPECKENPKLCEKATLKDFKEEIVNLEKKAGFVETVETTKACSKKGEPCFFSNDCCGDRLFCLGGSPGNRYCREIGEK